MPTDTIYVIGAGGHAKVVIDALMAAGVARARIRLSDANPARSGQRVLGIAIDHPAVRPEMGEACFHVAIGDGAARAALHAQLLALGSRPWTVRHPAASVSPCAVLGDGVFIAARAVVGPDAHVGHGAIVNHGAVVDHDCRVGAFCHVAPNATLGGAACLEEHVLIGAGANVLPGMHIGAGAVVGAGALVRGAVGAGQVWVGVPALYLKKD